MSQSKIIAVDLAKNVFEIGVATRRGRIIERQRLDRAGFQKLLATSPPALVLMEACGTCHYWGRVAQGYGHQVKIIPAQYVALYRLRNKTDRADVGALLEAHRCDRIKPVPLRCIDHQQIDQLHAMREQFKKTRVARINLLRGCLRELGIFIPRSAAKAMKAFAEAVDDESLPAPLRAMYARVVTEIRELERAMLDCEKQLSALTANDPAVAATSAIDGIGLLTSTAYVAVIGSPHRFRRGRDVSAWLGLTPREVSSGDRRYLGPISKRGNQYLRTLLIHGGRSVLAQAERRRRAGKPLTHLQRWGLQLRDRSGHNKAAVALANKLARIAWAVWKHQREYDGNFALRYAA